MKRIITLCMLGSVLYINSGICQDNPAFLNTVVTKVDDNTIQEAVYLPPAKSIDSTATACDSLTTVLTGGNSQKGNMFNVTALATGGVTITKFYVLPTATCGFRVYYRIGFYHPYENDSTHWTFLGAQDTVVPISSTHPVGLDIPINVTIPAGNTYAFYITSTSPNPAINMIYSDGDSATFTSPYRQDANILFFQGIGIKYPFSGTPYTPRIWNGRIDYCYTPLGIEEYNMPTVKTTVAPNPFDDFTILKIDGVTPNNYNLRVFDVLGNIVNEIDNITNDEVKIEKGKLAAGVYMYRIYSKDGAVGNGKIIIE